MRPFDSQSCVPEPLPVVPSTVIGRAFLRSQSCLPQSVVPSSTVCIAPSIAVRYTFLVGVRRAFPAHHLCLRHPSFVPYSSVRRAFLNGMYASHSLSLSKASSLLTYVAHSRSAVVGLDFPAEYVQLRRSSVDHTFLCCTSRPSRAL